MENSYGLFLSRLDIEDKDKGRQLKDTKFSLNKRVLTYIMETDKYRAPIVFVDLDKDIMISP